MAGLNPQGDRQFFEQALFTVTGQSLSVKDLYFASGGCINNAVQLITNRGDFFIKWNESSDLEGMFQREAEGLDALRQPDGLSIPEVIGYGTVHERQFLVLEHLRSGHRQADYWEQLGRGLALQHQTHGEAYGFTTDNFIGRLPQSNTPTDRWVTFFIEQRLQVQAGLAFYDRRVDSAFLDRMHQLYDQLPGLLVDGPPALLHGDLWSGNVMVGRSGEPCLIDPAVYYGHPEIELAFTHLFGGFDDRFYAAYEEVAPLVPGFLDRLDLYNLYPLLVHLNLFGASYLSGVERILSRFGC